MTKLDQFLLPIFTLCLLVPVALWLAQTSDLRIYFMYETPDGQLPYVLSKLAGMMALVCIAWQFILGQLRGLGWSDVTMISQNNRRIGLATLAFAVSHLGLFFTAVTLRQDHPAWPLLLPNFKDFYHIYLTLGWFGLCCLLCVFFIGVLRIKNRFAKSVILPKLYWAALVLVTLHAFTVGSDAQLSAGMAFYSGLALVVVVLMGVNYLKKYTRSAATQ